MMTIGTLIKVSASSGDYATVTVNTGGAKTIAVGSICLKDATELYEFGSALQDVASEMMHPGAATQAHAPCDECDEPPRFTAAGMNG